MALSKEQALELLTHHGAQFDCHEHVAVMTCEAQAQTLAGVEGWVTKNLFLRDKKRRQYVVTALADTKIDLKVLSARLGTGKGGVSWCSEEALASTLQVELGCVTPLALANASAAGVGLLLDQKLRDAGAFFVHPIVNTASVKLDAAGLEAFVRGIGREPLWVDLELDPKIDKDNPPDLKQFADTLPAPPAEESSADGSQASGATTTAAVVAGAAAAVATGVAAAAGGKKAKGASKASSKAAAPAVQSDALQHVAITNVPARTEALLDTVCAALLGGKTFAQADLDPYVSARLHADVEMQLNAFKNAAYTSGYVSAREQVVAYATKRWS